MSKKVAYVYIVLVLLYLGMTLFASADPRTMERFNITQTQTSLLSLSVAIPLIGIWFAAFYGYSKFKDYANKIRESKDGKAFTFIADGLGLLALSLPVTTIVSSGLRNLARQSPDLLPVTTIISNYLTLVFALAAFLLIYKGSKLLVTLVTKTAQPTQPYLVVGFGLFAILYTYLTLSDPNRQIAVGAVERAAYYLPDALILLTIIIPYLAVWFIGLKALINIRTYRSQTVGIVYKQTLTYLLRGIAGVIVLSILLQFLKVMSYALAGLSLGALLFIVYLLLIAMAAGYVFIAAGAKRLQKIEEV